MDPDVGTVDPERLGGLGELDRLGQRLMRGARARPRRVLPVAEREEADAGATDQR